MYFRTFLVIFLGMVAVEKGCLAESHSTICTLYTCFFSNTVFTTYAAFSHSTVFFLFVGGTCTILWSFKPPSRRFSGSFIGGSFNVFGDRVGTVEFEAKISSLALLCPSLLLVFIYSCHLFNTVQNEVLELVSPGFVFLNCCILG